MSALPEGIEEQSGDPGSGHKEKTENLLSKMHPAETERQPQMSLFRGGR